MVAEGTPPHVPIGRLELLGGGVVSPRQRNLLPGPGDRGGGGVEVMMVNCDFRILDDNENNDNGDEHGKKKKENNGSDGGGFFSVDQVSFSAVSTYYIYTRVLCMLHIYRKSVVDFLLNAL